MSPLTNPAAFSPGWSMQTMHIFPPLLVCHLLRYPLAINHPCFLRMRQTSPVPSVQHHLRRCCNICRRMREMLQKAVAHQRYYAALRTPAPRHTPGQKVWLSTRDVPLRSVTGKLVPRFIGPYEVDTVIPPSTLKLKLPAAIKIRPTFHFS